MQVDNLRQKKEKDFARADQERARADQKRARADADRIRLEQQRQAELNRRPTFNSDQDRRNDNNRYNNWGNSYGSGYRVYRNGSYYDTDSRGAELLQQAVNAGYQQGFQAGQYDRNDRRRNNWNKNGIYRSGNFGYENGVDRGQYQYYFQQGFQRGYQDGYNSRNQFGNGSNILGDILGSILNIQTY